MASCLGNPLVYLLAFHSSSTVILHCNWKSPQSITLKLKKYHLTSHHQQFFSPNDDILTSQVYLTLKFVLLHVPIELIVRCLNMYNKSDIYHY